MSINQIAARFNLSQPAQAAIMKGLKKPALANEMFSFDADEFKARRAATHLLHATGELVLFHAESIHVNCDRCGRRVAHPALNNVGGDVVTGAGMPFTILINATARAVNRTGLS